jgi:ribosome-binding factor A
MESALRTFSFGLERSAKTMSRRTERVASTIQKELAAIILHEISDPRLTGLPSITRVKLSEDLSIADVFLTIMGTSAQQNATLGALRHSAGMMRTKLTKVLMLRVAPFIKFHIDENLKKELEVLDLLRAVARENEELDRKRAQGADSKPDESSMTGSDVSAEG